MSQTKVNLGRVPKERGEYSATAKYYKDNIVEYGGSAYIASPTSSVNDGNDGTTDNPEYYLKNRVPFVTDPNTANAGWRIFASGRHVFSTGEDISSVGIDEEPVAGSRNLVESGGVAEDLINLSKKTLKKGDNESPTQIERGISFYQGKIINYTSRSMSFFSVSEGEIYYINKSFVTPTSSDIVSVIQLSYIPEPGDGSVAAIIDTHDSTFSSSNEKYVKVLKRCKYLGISISGNPTTATAYIQKCVSALPDIVQNTSDISKIDGYLEGDVYPITGYKENIYDSTTNIIGKYYNESFEEKSDNLFAHTDFIKIDTFDQIIYQQNPAPGSQAVQRYVFFLDENKEKLSVFQRPTDTNSHAVDVPEGAVYLVADIIKASVNNLSIIGKKIGSYENINNEVASNTDNITDIYRRYGDLTKAGEWVRGGWYAWNDFRPNMYKNRASINTIIHFDETVELVAKRGFKIISIYHLNGESKSTGAYHCNWEIPAGADAVITVARINEIPDEELTPEQVEEFSKAIMITNISGSDYSLYRDTFTDITMFETMAIIGDSYSAGSNGNNWGKCLGRITGVDITVWAQSGYTSADWITTYLQSLLEAEAKGLYWINLGINDGNRVLNDPSYLGSVADIDEETYQDFNFPDTFWGNMGKIIRNIQTHAPNSKIVLEKTMFQTMYNAQTNIATSKTKDINDAIVAISEHYGLPCIDQLDDAFYCSMEYQRSMISNHPRKYTWPGMAYANRRLFSKAVLDNPEYFY